MSEPVIPERMDCGVPDGTIFECQKPGLLARLKQAEDENWVYRQSVIWPPDYERLQAKVAEQEATHTAMLDDLRARLKESEELSWKNWRGREEAYAEMRVCRAERDDAVNMIRKQAATIAELTKELAAYKPHCGHTILSDSLGRIYGCGKPQGHDGAHETIEERRTAMSNQEPK